MYVTKISDTITFSRPMSSEPITDFADPRPKIGQNSGVSFCDRDCIVSITLPKIAKR